MIAIIAAFLIATTVAANTFYFHWIATPFEPNQYNWSEPWEVKEMVDFLEATLTLTGCGYEGQSHDLELAIKNVATVANYYVTAFDYSAKWYIDETHQESIIAGTYTGEPLAVGENVTYTDVWVPTVIGVGEVKMNIIDIVWAQADPITWTTEVQNSYSDLTISNFDVTGASLSYVETGLVNFTITYYNIMYSFATISFKVEVVELTEIITEELDVVLQHDTPTDFGYVFGPLTQGGDLTMKLTITAFEYS